MPFPSRAVRTHLRCCCPGHADVLLEQHGLHLTMIVVHKVRAGARGRQGIGMFGHFNIGSCPNAQYLNTLTCIYDGVTVFEMR